MWKISTIKKCSYSLWGDHATNLSTPIDDNQKKDGYYLGLCRIEPENNIEMILNAFINTDKKIKFMGNWDNSEYGRQLKNIIQTIQISHY